MAESEREDSRHSAGEGTDATTGAEEGIGSGVGTGIGSQTTAGEIDGQGYGVTSGATPTGTNGAEIGNESLGEKIGVPPNAGADSIDEAGENPEATALTSTGSGLPPRAADGSLLQGPDDTTDADRVRKVVSGARPDAGNEPGGRP